MLIISELIQLKERKRTRKLFTYRINIIIYYELKLKGLKFIKEFVIKKRKNYRKHISWRNFSIEINR